MGKRRTDPLNFSIVKRQIIKEYLKLYDSPRDNDEWSLKNCIELFRIYYILYKEHFGIDHPNLTDESMDNVLEEIPYIGGENGERDVDFSDCVSLEDYPDLIEAYFNSEFREGCDYSISHFMSGQIRMIKFYENMY